MLQAGSLEINTLWPAEADLPKSTEDFYQGLHQDLSALAPQALNLWPSADALKSLFSPFALEVPKSIHDQAQRLIQGLWELSQNADYRDLVAARQQNLSPNWPTPSGVLMAYDFHVNEDSELRLIEVNTNAAGFLFVDQLYKHNLFLTANQNPSLATATPPLDQLLASFARDYNQHKSTHSEAQPDFSSCHLAIVDQNLLDQKMLAEFYLYQNFFSSRGIKCSVVDLQDLRVDSGRLHDAQGQVIDFVYNRCTDFYLEENESSALRWAYDNRACCVSPHPAVYALLADKRRVMDWQSWASLPTELNKYLLKTRPLSSFSEPEEVWAQRKNLFFKPQSSHGGKQVYKGASLSRRMFTSLLQNPDILTQEYFPAGQPKFAGPLRPERPEGWKYDLRFYVYEDQIQLSAARLFQGQVTNFSTPFGGFAALTFS